MALSEPEPRDNARVVHRDCVSSDLSDLSTAAKTEPNGVPHRSPGDFDMVWHLTAATLVVIVTVAGLVCVGVAVTAVLNQLLRELRTRRRSPEPLDEQLCGRAAAAVERMCQRAGVAAPTAVVVPLLGRPFPGAQPRLGTGGLAVTRFRPGRPVGVVFARAALTELSDPALDNLVGHELAHVIRYRTLAGRARHYGWVLGFVLVQLAIATWMVAARSGAVLAAAGPVTLIYLAVRLFRQRREELAADRYAIELTADLAGAEELMGFYDQHMRDRPARRGRLRRAAVSLGRRGLATHPEPQLRLAVMRGHRAQPNFSTTPATTPDPS